MNTIEHDESMKDLPMLDHTAMVIGHGTELRCEYRNMPEKGLL